MELTLEDLPEEILLYLICNFLEPRNTAPVSLVNHRFHALCSDSFVWKVYYHKRFPKDEVLDDSREFRYSSNFQFSLHKEETSTEPEDEDVEFVRREYSAFIKELESEREYVNDWRSKFQVRLLQDHKLEDFEHKTKAYVLAKNLKKETREVSMIAMLSGFLLIGPCASLVFCSGFHERYRGASTFYLASGAVLCSSVVTLQRLQNNPKTNTAFVRQLTKVGNAGLLTWFLGSGLIFITSAVTLCREPDTPHRLGLLSWVAAMGYWGVAKNWNGYLCLLLLPNMLASSRGTLLWERLQKSAQVLYRKSAK